MALYEHPATRFFEKIDTTGDCWEWTAYRDKDGYGAYSPHSYGVKKNPERAHRYMYELISGEPIPKGIFVHHRCGNKACVRFSHLELVTPRENLFRSDTPARRNARKTTCLKGHPLSGDNLYMRKDGRKSRECRACRRLAVRRYDYRQKMINTGVSP